ncbi:MAG: aminomethyl-transferring glycine dehydrogenase subunit GcvPA [bacterium JZ-2024 1]
MKNRYLPHTTDEIRQMLDTIGVSDIEELFQDIPAEFRLQRPLQIEGPLAESELLSLARERSARNLTVQDRPFFLGGGHYYRHVPPVIDEVIHRGEFYTAYTPYQPEISQGTLQALYEFQSVIARLAGLDAAHASSYDGATALADGLRMALSLTDRKKVVVSRSIHPEYRAVIDTYLRYLDVEFVEVPIIDGTMDVAFAEKAIDEQTAVLVVQNPNFLGYLESDWPRLAARAHEVGAKVLYSGDPIAMAVLAPPGPLGADIVTGEGQPLGIPLQFGGPSFGFLATRKEFIYQMPGRVIGRTVDSSGQTCFVMTLRFREQDIKRHRATSNLCTNNALMALRGLIYVLVMGPDGLRRVAELSASAAHSACEALSEIGIRPYADAPFLWEYPVVLKKDPVEVNRALCRQGIIGGLPLKNPVAIDAQSRKPRPFYDYLGLKNLKNGWLLAFTEMSRPEFVASLVKHLCTIL